MTALPAAPAPAKPRRRLRLVRWLLLTLFLSLASLSVPQIFQVACRGIIQLQAWRQGTEVSIARVGGSFWEPLVLEHSLWRFAGHSGAVTRIEIARTEMQFSWKDLFRRNGDRWFQRIKVSGVQGKIEIPINHPPEAASASAQPKPPLRLPKSGWLPLPDEIEAQEVDLIFQSDDDYVRLEKASFSASTMQAGQVHVSKLTIRQPWLKRSFRNVRGKTAIQDNRIALADVVLEPGIDIKSLNASPDGLAQGSLDLEGEVAAFDGALRFEAATKPSGRGFVFETSGTFGQINIAKLASFLALSDAAGGTIKDGKFTFRGPPRNFARAQATLRFDAVNFQWESRQWDSLALGVVLVDRRLQVPQLNLRQGKNELRLSGELALPDRQQKWWQGDFTANVDARIENLTELSALLLPEFKYAAGKATIEGSIRGRGEEFNGQLLVSGSNLTWRNAPIETLHGAIKLNGKEIHVANVELVNHDDYLRGRGLVKLTSPPVYWGEFRVAVEDLANYAAFLAKPVLPEPLAGGAIIDWTGEGSKEGHSGKFLARLRKVRTLGALAPQLHPINADLDASYSPGSMQFTRFSLSDDESVFTASIAVGGKALHLQRLILTHQNAVQLEGDAILPLDVWQQWPNVSVDKLLNEDVVSRVQLTARKLDLAKASLLTGWRFPIAGIADGTFVAEGSIKALKLGGTATLSQGRIPLGWSGNVLSDTSARFTFRDNAVVVDQFTGKHKFGEFQIAGSLALGNVLNPTLDFTVKSPRLSAPLYQAAAGDAPKVTATTALDLAISGPLNTATAKGTANLLALSFGGAPDLRNLWATDRIRLPNVFSFPSAPWSTWQYDLTSKTESPIRLTDSAGTVNADIHITGPGSAPVATGRLDFANVQAIRGGPPDQRWGAESDASRTTLMLDRVTVEFTAARSQEPVIDLEGRGTMLNAPFWVEVTGPLGQLIRVYDGPPPLTDDSVRELLSGAAQITDGPFGLEIYPPIVRESGIPVPAPAQSPAPAQGKE